VAIKRPGTGKKKPNKKIRVISKVERGRSVRRGVETSSGKWIIGDTTEGGLIKGRRIVWKKGVTGVRNREKRRPGLLAKSRACAGNLFKVKERTCNGSGERRGEITHRQGFELPQREAPLTGNFRLSSDSICSKAKLRQAAGDVLCGQGRVVLAR